MQNLAILTNGGDTCALNASIEAIRREARKVGFGKIIGIEGGYHGLLYKKFRILAGAVDEKMGGTVLRSLRESPCKLQNGKYVIDDEKASKMIKVLEELEVDVLVVIGGDGTLQATKLFHQTVQDKYRFGIVGFPKTIDNDIRTKSTFEGIEVALCPGFPTAAQKISRVAEEIRTTAISAQRVFGIETMGRDAGWLAAAADGGGPDIILIPEVPLNNTIKNLLLQRIEKLFRHSLNVVFVISEGACWTDEKSGKMVQIKTTEFGPRKLGGVVDTVVKYIEKKLESKFDEETPFEVRPHHCDYVPRAGSPCDYDLKLVNVLAQKLGDILEHEQWGKVPVLREVVPYDKLSLKCTGALDIEEMEQKLFPKKDFYDEKRLHTNKRFSRFLRTITSGPEFSK